MAIYNKYYLEKLYHNLGIGLRLVLPFIDSVNEIGPGGGRTYVYFLQLVREMRLNMPSYLGYEISQQCVYYLQTRYGDHWALQDVAFPTSRTADLSYFYDVLVHSDRPVEFLVVVCRSSIKYICFQTPTRDQGSTETDPENSYRMVNGSQVPWIVFYLDEFLAIMREQGVIKFILLKQHKNVVGNGPRYLPKDLLTSGTARTSILGIRNEGFNEDLRKTNLLENEVNSVEEIRIPRFVRASNTLHKYWSLIRSSKLN